MVSRPAGGGIPALPNAHPLDMGSILAMSSTQPSSTSSNPVTTQADSMLANLQNNNSGVVCFQPTVSQCCELSRQDN